MPVATSMTRLASWLVSRARGALLQDCHGGSPCLCCILPHSERCVQFRPSGRLGPVAAGDFAENIFHAGYVTYSPYMELEADQFAMYVLNNNGNRRLDAGTDLIISSWPTTDKFPVIKPKVDSFKW